MKKTMIIIMCIVAFIYLYVFISRCGILPKDTNYKIVFGDRLYKLTKNGLTEIGCIQNRDWNMVADFDTTFFNRTQKMLYFYAVNDSSGLIKHGQGIYKLDLSNSTIKPSLVLKTHQGVSILPNLSNNNFLQFSLYINDEKKPHHGLVLLSLTTGKQQIVVDDYNDSSNTVWLNDHQFIYESNKLREIDKEYDLILADMSDRSMRYRDVINISEQPNKQKIPVLMKDRNEFFIYGIKDGLWQDAQLTRVSKKMRSLPFNKEPVMIKCNDPELIEELTAGHTTKKRILFLYDINTKTKTDLHLDGYYLGTLSPDGKRLLLADNKKTILYDINDGSTEVIANRKMQIERAIWLPDGKGFLYSDGWIGELLDCCVILCDGHYGLYYYSLEKKKSVRLSQFYNLTSRGGFVVPEDIDIKLPNTELNRKIWSGELKNHHLVKIGKFW